MNKKNKLQIIGLVIYIIYLIVIFALFYNTDKSKLAVFSALGAAVFVVLHTQILARKDK